MTKLYLLYFFSKTLGLLELCGSKCGKFEAVPPNITLDILSYSTKLYFFLWEFSNFGMIEIFFFLNKC